MVGDLIGAGDDEVGGGVFRFVEVVGHHVGHPAQGVLLFVVEMSYEEKAHLVAAHEVDQLVVLLLGQVGRRGGAVVIAGAEKASVGGHHHMAVFVAVLEQLAQPLQLAPSVGGVATVEEDEEVGGSAEGFHGDGIGGGVEILLVVLLAVEIDVVVADGGEAGVGRGRGAQQAVQLAEGPWARLVGYVAVHDAEEPCWVGPFGTEETLHAFGVAFQVDVGADVDVVAVGGIGYDGGGMLLVPGQPLGHAVFGVGAAGEEHAFDVEAVARPQGEGYGNDENIT